MRVNLSNANLFSVMILSGISMQAVAGEYWVGRDGDFVRDRNGHCVRTIEWTESAAVAGCEGGEAVAGKVATNKDDNNSNKSQSSNGDNAVDAEQAAVVAAAAALAAAAVSDESVYETYTMSGAATFEHGGSELSAEGKAAIVGLVAQHEGKTVDSVIIEGYSDSSGSAAFNQQLSEQRAEAVKTELVANGAKAEKISTVGYGESNPIADNSTREGRAKNRRVEIKVDGVKESDAIKESQI